MKDAYNASMIHELRNPLNAVLGSIGLLKYSKSLSKDDCEALNIACVSGEILITLINNALDGAKIEANRLELDPHLSNIIEILSNSLNLYQWKAKEKQIEPVLLVSKEMPDRILIDEARLMQILVNIIGNAVKFTPIQGSIKLRAQFVQEKDETKVPKEECGALIDEEDEEEFEKKHFYRKKLTMGQFHI
jgi:signal transduction histidine kinase